MRVSKNKKVEPVQPITRVQPVKRRETPYQGDIDPAVIIHSSKTHRTASEAFKDATYATPFWRCETEWDRTKEYLKWIVMWAGLLYGFYALAVWFNEVVG